MHNVKKFVAVDQRSSIRSVSDRDRVFSDHPLRTRLSITTVACLNPQHFATGDFE